MRLFEGFELIGLTFAVASDRDEVFRDAIAEGCTLLLYEDTRIARGTEECRRGCRCNGLLDHREESTHWCRKTPVTFAVARCSRDPLLICCYCEKTKLHITQANEPAPKKQNQYKVAFGLRKWNVPLPTCFGRKL